MRFCVLVGVYKSHTCSRAESGFTCFIEEFEYFNFHFVGCVFC